MERLQNKLDSGTYAKLTGNLVNNISLWDLSSDDLTLMDITEVGPRRIILNFIERNREAYENQTENIADNGQDVPMNEQRVETIRSVLVKDHKFQNIVTKQLDRGLIPVEKKLLKMNRILTDHFFGDIMFRQNRHPTVYEKQQLAVRILEEFPHLEQIRVSENAPADSYFFWMHGGLETGRHTGLIETRVGNMGKGVPSEDRKFQRSQKRKIDVDEEQVDIAGHISALNPNSANAKQISDGMSRTHDLHEWLLRKKPQDRFKMIIEVFPHFLCYDGEMIIQAFDRFHKQPANRPSLYTLLHLGLLCGENNSWSEVQDDDLRGTLRLMKKLSNRGIKRSTTKINASVNELAAEPLIKWINFPQRESGFDELLAVQQSQSVTVGDPHIICAADLYKQGNYYVTYGASVIPCGSSCVRAVEVFFKAFVVFGADVPVLLRKLDAMISDIVWGSKSSSKFKIVSALASRFKEFLKKPQPN